MKYLLIVAMMAIFLLTACNPQLNEELRQKIIVTNENVSFYYQELDAVGKGTITTSEKKGALTFSTTSAPLITTGYSTGYFDRSSRRMLLATNVSIVSQGAEREFTTLVYSRDSVLYQRGVEYNKYGNSWTSQQLIDVQWMRGDSHLKFLEYIKSGTLKLQRKEMREGRETYVFRVTPSQEALLKNTVSPEYLQLPNTFFNYRLDMWVDVKTLRIVAMYESYALETAYPQMNAMGNLDMHTQATFSDFDEYRVLEMPEELSAAIGANQVRIIG